MLHIAPHRPQHYLSCESTPSYAEYIASVINDSAIDDYRTLVAAQQNKLRNISYTLSQ